MSGSRFAGRVAFVTGGASGIGAATVARFRSEGAEVVVADLDVSNLPTGVMGVETDVRNEGAVEAAVAATVEHHDRLDIAVNSAGVGGFAPLMHLDEADWDRIVDVCLKGVFLSLKHEAKAMADGGGVIVNIASINAQQPAVGVGAYCAAKAGVEMLTKVAAKELGPKQIRVVGVSPGIVDTPLTAHTQDPKTRAAYVDNIPLGRIGNPDDVASAVLFLASDDAGWISGDTMLVDGASATERYPDLRRLGGRDG